MDFTQASASSPHPSPRLFSFPPPQKNENGTLFALIPAWWQGLEAFCSCWESRVDVVVHVIVGTSIFS